MRRNSAARFNRRMRKTARPVVWEGGRAQSRPLDPIRGEWLRFEEGKGVVEGLPDSSLVYAGPKRVRRWPSGSVQLAAQVPG